MEIDKKIELPMGTVHFKGELSEEEVEQLITLGLIFSFMRGDLETIVTTEDGSLVAEVPDQIQ